METTILHYRILEKIGQGGMGIVYRAEDTKLKRTVALKFLPETLVSDHAAKRRFLHEARAASKLDHPNICSIHEIEETQDGRLFICMSWCDGVTLQERSRLGGLSLAQILDIAIQIGDGLVEAHAAGIVHRDMKPANVMVSPGGHVKILDFGLARTADASLASRSGSLMGTLSYMSPERFVSHAADERSDIWSLGVILYELVTGRLPFEGDYEAAVLYAITHDEPERPSKRRADMPRALEEIILRSLRKRPDGRYASMAEMTAELRSIRSALGATSAREAALPRPPRRAVARSMVLAGALVAAVVAAALVAGGKGYLGEWIRSSKAARARRYYRDGEAAYRGGDPERGMRLIGKALSTDSTFENATDAHRRLALWANYTKNRPAARLHARKLVGLSRGDSLDELRARIVEYRVTARFDSALAAMKRYLRIVPDDIDMHLDLGYTLYHDTLRFLESRWYLERALEMDPENVHGRNAKAYDCLTHASIYLGWFEQAEHYADACLKLDPDNIDALHSRATLDRWRGNYGDAIDVFTEIITRDPTFFVDYDELAACYLAIGKWNKSLAKIDEYLGHAPGTMRAEALAFKALVYFVQQDYGRAAETARGAIGADSLSFRAHWLRGRAGLALHRSDIAIAELRTLERLSRGPSCCDDRAYCRSLRGWVLLRDGDVAEGIAELEAALASTHEIPFFTKDLVRAYLQAGMTDRAIALAFKSRGMNEHDGEIDYLLGRAYEQRGGVESALSFYRQAMHTWQEYEADENFRPLAEAKSKLAGLTRRSP